MSEKKVIVVIGATGFQGGSVVRFLVKDGTFHVRAVTRKLNSPAAEALIKQGVEVVFADLEDKESLLLALKGAYGVFGITNFWEAFYDKEIAQGKRLADAAKESGIQHFVWSSLDHSYCPHFESKALVQDHIKEIGLPYTEILTSFYFESIGKGGFKIGIEKNDKGEYHISLPIDPTAKMPGFSVGDLGGFVVSTFLHPEKYLGKTLPITAEFISINEIAAVFEKVTGHKLHPLQIDLQGMKDYGAQGFFQNEIYLNLLYFYENQSGIRDPVLSKQIFPELHSWEAFLKENLALYYP